MVYLTHEIIPNTINIFPSIVHGRAVVHNDVGLDVGLHVVDGFAIDDGLDAEGSGSPGILAEKQPEECIIDRSFSGGVVAIDRSGLSVQGDYLIVRETVVMADGKEIRKSGPKEEKRTRALRIPKHIRDLIDKVDGDIIVPATANSITKRYRRILEAAGVPYLNFHGLRHINSSVMGSLLVDPATAMARGGWKNDSVMYQVYTHSLSQKRTQADDKIDEYFESILGTEK